MAEDKKGFILYADVINLTEELTDEEAGKLFKHILRYVNDQNPEAPDRVTKIAFEPIKQQLKRDLKKYESKKVKLSEAGRISAEKRKTEKEQMSTNVENVEPGSTTFNQVQPPSTNSTVIVNDNVTVNVKDNVIVKDIKSKEERSALFAQRVFLENDFHKILEPPELKKFIDYWNESGDNQKKLRHEKETVFEIKRRLETWRSRIKTKPNATTETRYDKHNTPAPDIGPDLAAYRRSLISNQDFNSAPKPS